MTVHDVIVVGSGAAGATAAHTLVESGRSVLMLDGGQRDEHYASIVPDRSFVSLRREDPAQHRYFLGDNFEALSTIAVKTGAQLTPPRRYLIRDVERYLGIAASDFSPLESLARGGLAGGWGLGCAVFSPEELSAASLPEPAMRDAYQVVADRIGLSGADDDARPFTSAHLSGVQPALPIDPAADVLLGRYRRRRAEMLARGFHVGRPALALLSEDFGSRRGSQMHDMEFYTDHGSSAWRAWMTIDVLAEKANFIYQGGTLVTRFDETSEAINVEVLRLETGIRSSFRCRRLVLAAGALGTARIVLRSQGGPGARVPLLCNPYAYLPCLVPERLGRMMPDNNIALCQLAMFHDADGEHRDVAMGFIYSYRSLMMFRLMAEVPLALACAPAILRYLLSGFLIVGIHHPHRNAGDSYVRLDSDPSSATGDRLFVDFRLTDAERQRVTWRMRTYAAALRTIGAIPVRTVQPGNGSSIHYAGTIPCADHEEPLTTSRDGRLHATQHVYVADSSSFTFLPAKGVTLSTMARAHAVAAHVAGR